jgi:hypothetical protein
MRVNQKARLVCIDEAGDVVGVISMSDLAQYDEEGRAGDVMADVTEREAHVLAAPPRAAGAAILGRAAI